MQAFRITLNPEKATGAFEYSLNGRQVAYEIDLALATRLPQDTALDGLLKKLEETFGPAETWGE